jgi:hypothetical protein
VSALPDAFCWTKFGAEAGELPSAIFQRKELERSRNGGIFLWGIGQSIGPSLPELLRLAPEPEVLFSPMRTRAAARDTSPAAVVRWRGATGYDGRRYVIPEHSLVTSRMNPGRPQSAHYALVCKSHSPLTTPGDDEHLALETLRNLRSGTSLGASQVTAVVRRAASAGPSRVNYPVTARAWLVYPYLVRLTRPACVSDNRGGNRSGHAKALPQAASQGSDGLFSVDEVNG